MLKSRKLSRATRWVYGIIAASMMWQAVADWPKITAWRSTQGVFFVLDWVVGGCLLYSAVTGGEPDWKWESKP